MLHYKPLLRRAIYINPKSHSTFKCPVPAKGHIQFERVATERTALERIRIVNGGNILSKIKKNRKAKKK